LPGCKVAHASRRSQTGGRPDLRKIPGEGCKGAKRHTPLDRPVGHGSIKRRAADRNTTQNINSIKILSGAQEEKVRTLAKSVRTRLKRSLTTLSALVSFKK
ncbi:MAG: hypothetical protein AAF865_11880, partial [Pseudomonadota bacterium]